MQRRQHKTTTTANYSDTPAPNQFAPRPFIVQTQADTVTAQQKDASDIQVTEAPKLQMKLSFGESQVVQRHQEEDEVQMKPDVQRHQEEDEVQMKPDIQRHQEEDEAIQRQTNNSGSFQADGNLESRIRGNQSGGQPLDAGVRAFMEPRFGHSFAGVRVHTNSESVQMNQELHAQAFTNGQHIYFNEGKYNPGSDSGKQLLAHELTHTIQQTGGNELQRQPQSNCGAACQCPTCVPVNPLIQRQISLIHPGTQDLLNRKLTDVVQAHGMSCPCPNCCTPGVQIQRQTEAKHGAGCSCSMCASKIQTKLTVGAPGDRYEQEADKIAAQVIRMPESQPTDSIQRHEEEELAQTKPLGTKITPVAVQRHNQEEELAQTKAESSTITPTIQATTISGIIQRHASWEHKMLGDVTPDALEIMGAGRNDYNGLGTATDEQGNAIRITEGLHQGQYITREMVLHTIGQEIRRLEYFRNRPPQEASPEEVNRLKDQDANDRAEEAYQQTRSYAASLAEFQDDKAWQVRLVNVPLQNGRSEVVTYGEMNTLADIYGSVDELQHTNHANLHGVIQGIRQESLFKFMKLYEEISGTTKYQDLAAEKRKQQSKEKGSHNIRNTARKALDYDPSYEGLEFEGAIGNTGKGNDYGELSFMGKIPEEQGKEALAQKPETSYLSGLARNACHFAPESWIAWRDYHEKATNFAQKAYYYQEIGKGLGEVLRRLYPDDRDSKSGELFLKSNAQTNLEQNLYPKIKQAKSQAANSANLAYLNNGFGDHYLQDSYAAGHLINKTQIMQWYVKYIDQKGEWDYHKDKNWRKLQDMAYSQPGLADRGQYDKAGIISGNVQARNPQHVADMEGDWKAKHDALGLQVPQSIQRGSNSYKLLTEWQEAIAERNLGASIRIDELTYIFHGDLYNTKAALRPLLKDGIVRFANYNTKQRGKEITLNRGESANVPKDNRIRLYKTTEVELRENYRPSTSKEKNSNFYSAISAIDEDNPQPNEYQDMVKGVNYQEYQEFMRSGFIQKSTNALHDYFCREGLDVYSGDSQKVFKVYGDNAMLQKGSSQGVKHSAQTSRMSVESIDDIIANGVTNKTTDVILRRFPEGVRWQGAEISLAQWHNGGELQNFCNETIFPSMAWDVKQKFAPGVVGHDLGVIFSENDQPHGGEVF
ncbi:eCIS core domain-containing protein [Aliinostoc sp. HNIBRCY26]|uniref:eCIS core domain-containing protein n=1 Tax=Aliinostoc sp. HNIBRCY26 TaxID=3418997 RepID=UPI003D06A9C0